MKGRPIALISFRFEKEDSERFEQKLQQLIDSGKASSKVGAVEILLQQVIDGKVKKDKPVKIDRSTHSFRCDYEVYLKVVEKCKELNMPLTEAVRRLI